MNQCNEQIIINSWKKNVQPWVRAIRKGEIESRLLITNAAIISAIFSAAEEHLGFIPDGLKLYSISPPLLENFFNTVGYFMAHQTLSQELLAMTRYLVSSKEDCYFYTPIVMQYNF